MEKYLQKPDYGKIYSNSTHNRSDISSKTIISMAKKFLGQNILDAGAGNGSFVSSLRQTFPQKNILGIDLHPKNDLVIKGSVTSLPFQTNAFDTYISTDLIEHLTEEDLDLCLKEAYRVLKPRGYGIFNTPNNEDLESHTSICPYCNNKFHIVGHLQSFSIDKIRIIFQRNGFKLIKYRVFNFTVFHKFPLLGRLFYFLNIHKLLPFKILTSDLFFIVKKEGSI